MAHHEFFFAECPTRLLVSEISNKWSMMILCVLNEEPLRFNEIKRRLEGISQKSLALTLRKLERNGIILRRVIEQSPMCVNYSITELGYTLLEPYKKLYQWTLNNVEAVDSARRAFDAKQGEPIALAADS